MEIKKLNEGFAISFDDLIISLGEEIKSFLDKDLSLNKIMQTRNDLDRIIYLIDFNVDTSIGFHNQVEFYNKVDEDIPVEERKPITVYVDSPGGDLCSCFSMIDTINNSKTPIHAHVIGNAASCGFLFTISCHKRIGTPLSSYLFHKGSAGMAGTADQVLSSTNHYSKQLKQMKKIVLDKTNISNAKWKKIEKDDYWMDANEALKLGVIDEIAGNPIEI